MLSQAVSLGQAHLGDELGARLASKVKMAHLKKKHVLGSVQIDSCGPYKIITLL